ncbi:MAG: Wzz/FepE/Etk N-terminal domain-containing protein [Pseudomonadota bacterium]|nr:Wzz/FepE/Etk N-terminal domain-containing protein [Pseudomonadota bacterium]
MTASIDKAAPTPAAKEFQGDAFLRLLRERWRLVIAAPVLFGALGIAGSFLVTPRFTSSTLFIPPQQQGSAAGALASLGSLAGLAGVASTKSSVDQYVSLLQSNAVVDRLIDHFKLLGVYDVKFRDQARTELARRSSIFAGRKDGLVTVAVEDTDPLRAAALANLYVDELRRLAGTLAISEAQQRRTFFESQLQLVKTKLVMAQTALQESGVGQASLKAEPAAAAATYARMRADLAAAQVRLETSKGSLADGAPLVREQAATVAALQSQIHALESSVTVNSSDPDYTSKYREFKHEESLFDVMARQYEIARVDESREGALLQVVDVALPAERKSSPKRLVYGLLAAFGGTCAVMVALVLRSRRRISGP